MWHICWMSTLVRTKHSAFLRQIMNTKVVQPLGGHSIINNTYTVCMIGWANYQPPPATCNREQITEFWFRFRPRHLQRFGQRCVPYLQCTPPHLQSRLVRPSKRCRVWTMIYTPISHANHKSIYRYFWGEIVHPYFLLRCYFDRCLYWIMPCIAMRFSMVYTSTLDNTRSTCNRAIQFIFKYIKKTGTSHSWHVAWFIPEIWIWCH